MTGSERSLPPPSTATNSHAFKVYRLIAENCPGISPQTEGNTPTAVFESGDVAATSTESSGPVVGEAARRMFHRMGLVKTSRDSRATAKYIGNLVRDVSTIAGEREARVATVFASYAEGPLAVCGPDPLCSECVVTGLCRYFRRRPTIKDLPQAERPRERLVAAGEDSLTDAELLGIIIRDGTPEASAVDLAQKILSQYGTFRGLATKTTGELSKIKGIGPAKAAQVKAAMAIARRYAATPLAAGERVGSSKDVFNHFHERLRDRRQETFLIVLLDSKNKVIRDLQISMGSLSSSVVHPREVFAPAIKESASSVIFVHNHPSGDPTPSPEDLDITRRLQEVSNRRTCKGLPYIYWQGK